MKNLPPGDILVDVSLRFLVPTDHETEIDLPKDFFLVFKCNFVQFLAMAETITIYDQEIWHLPTGQSQLT